MSLKSLCIENISDIIKNLPPLIQEEILNVSIQKIKDDAKKEVVKDIKRYASCTVDDITTLILDTNKNTHTWKRPEYTNSIDDELYSTFVDISENFAQKYGEKLNYDLYDIINYQEMSTSSDDEIEYY